MRSDATNCRSAQAGQKKSGHVWPPAWFVAGVYSPGRNALAISEVSPATIKPIIQRISPI